MAAVPRAPLQHQAGGLLIDFRYHLISLIAVFLALGLGILMGSVVLSDRYVARLENRVKGIEAQLDQRREDIVFLNERLDVLEEFSVQVQPRVLDGALLGEDVVMIALPGTDGALRDALIEAIESADGEVASTLLLTERFALEDADARSELASILQASTIDPAALRSEAARTLGQRAALAAGRTDPTRNASTARLASFVEALRVAEFLDVTGGEDALVPPGAAFLVLGGAAEQPPEATVPMSLDLATALSARGAPVVITETSNSEWGLVQAVRDDAGAGAAVSTVDAGDSVPGRIAAVLALESTIDGVTGHYGTGDGATAIVPLPTPDD